MSCLVVTVRLLDDRYHGKLADDGPPEWPPSPFRLFCALVAGLARRGQLEGAGTALAWLQTLEAPLIIAPKAKKGQALKRYVPNNDGDKWPSRQDRLGTKPSLPTLFLVEPYEKPEVHYVWDVTGKGDSPTADIKRAARSVTALGWGIDMAFADARQATMAEIGALKGIRWYPKRTADSVWDTLRIPTHDAGTGECTLDDLRHCHGTFINRIEQGKPLKTVDKPKVFDRVLYASTERPIRRPFAVFKLLDSNEDPAQYPHARLVHIAGMVRHVAIEAMTEAGADADFVNRFIRGKRDAASGDEHKQMSYLPLPSIGHAHADGMIRNIMLVAPIGMERELADVALRIDGVPLKPEGHLEGREPESSPTDAYRAELRRFTPPKGKFIDTRYLGTSSIWQTVTPLILDGHNDKKPEKTIKLIQCALQRAGIETPCEFAWQSVPFFRNCLSAHTYDRAGRYAGYHRPAHLKDLTAVHVRIEFARPVPGPLSLGAGRHCGFGLMALAD